MGSQESNSLRARILREGFGWVGIPRPHPDPMDLETALPAFSEHCTSLGKWVVLDGYHLDESYQLAVQQAGHRILLIDDMAHLSRYHADILLNQNMSKGLISYRMDPETRLLMGHKYVLLRDEFLNWEGEKRQHPHVARKILVTLGGADPDNVTLAVIEALKRKAFSGLSVRVVIGASNPHRSSLEQTVSSVPFNCRLLETTERMPELMAWADMAVSGGGTTCWEMAFMGLPNLVVVLAENQTAVTDILRTVGCSEIIEGQTGIRDLSLTLDGLIHAPERRKQMSLRGRELIDGLGGLRVVEEILRRNREFDGERE